MFWLTVILVGWVLVGWPCSLWWRARGGGRPVKRRHMEPSVCVLLCVRNGERYLSRKLDSLLALEYPAEKIEILVINNQSDDETCRIASGYAERGVKLLHQPTGGKAEALNLGLSAATAEIVLITDVRQPLEATSLQELMACFADPEVGVVSGELRIVSAEDSEEHSVGAYWRFETWIRNQLSQLDSMLGATGPFYAIRRSLARPVPPGAILDDVCLPLQAFFAGYRLVMEPRAVAYDYPTKAATEFRRKVRTLAGNYQLIRYFPQLLGPANRLWFDYVSYKLGRLLLPFLLCGLFLLTFTLPPPWRIVFLVGQVLAYGVGLLDFWIPEGAILKKVSSPARVFLTMMAASACALSILFLPTAKLWRPTQTPVRNIPLKRNDSADASNSTPGKSS